jgi:hypothetical protein
MGVSEIENNESKKPLAEILKALNYRDEREAAIDITILSASAKYAEFAEECQRFERKHGVRYEEFESQVAERAGEVFEEEDDLMTWRFANDGAEFWHRKLEELKSAL